MPKADSPSTLHVSVIVPVYNHWELIPSLMAKLERQTLPSDRFEILVVDNGSDDVPAAPPLPGNARLLHCPTPGSYAARNRAIDEAEGQVLAFTDADCLPTAEWLETGLKRIEQHPDPEVIVAGGVRMVARDPDNPTPYELYDMALGIPQQRYVQRGYAVTANLFVPRAVFDLAGRFDATRFSGGDAEFCRRAVSLGAALEYDGAALVEHPARSDWQELAGKARRVKGGQIMAGPIGRRMLWLGRTCLPPVRAWRRAFAAPDLSVGQKLVASLVQTRLWGVELVETLLLILRIRSPRR